MKIKVGDNVVVIAGKDKGQIGIVKELVPKKDSIIVEGVNIRTIHIKPSQTNPDGGIEKIEKPVHISNVMINVGSTKETEKAKVTKIAYKTIENKNGKKDKKRIAKATGEEI